ncbi:MAG: hypothetical protein AAGG65_15670 [Pseudomonadota bacterium]
MIRWRGLAAIGLVALMIVFVFDAAATAQPMIPRGSAGAEQSSFLDVLPAPLRSVVQQINTWQVELSRRLNTELVDMRGGNGFAVFWLCLIGFVYGVLHAAGPGHGKAVVASYLLARRLSIGRAVGASFLMALGQGVTAIVLVGVLSVVLGLAGPALTARADWLELGSYGLIILLGLAMLVNSVRGRHTCGMDHSHDHDHDHSHHEHARDSGRGLLPLGAAVALRPCTGALLILLFTLANGLLLAGIAAVLAMAIGVGLTVAIIALATIGVRGAALAVAGGHGHGRGFVFAQRGLAIVGSTAVLAFGCLFFLAAAGRLF